MSVQTIGGRLTADFDFDKARSADLARARSALARLIGKRVASAQWMQIGFTILTEDGNAQRFFACKDPEALPALVGQEIIEVRATEGAFTICTRAGDEFEFYGWIDSTLFDSN